MVKAKVGASISGFGTVSIPLPWVLNSHVIRSQTVEISGQKASFHLSHEGWQASSSGCLLYCSIFWLAKIFSEEQRLASQHFNTLIYLRIGLPQSCHFKSVRAQWHRVEFSIVLGTQRPFLELFQDLHVGFEYEMLWIKQSDFAGMCLSFCEQNYLWKWNVFVFCPFFDPEETSPQELRHPPGNQKPSPVVSEPLPHADVPRCSGAKVVVTWVK